MGGVGENYNQNDLIIGMGNYLEEDENLDIDIEIIEVGDKTKNIIELIPKYKHIKSKGFEIYNLDGIFEDTNEILNEKNLSIYSNKIDEAQNSKYYKEDGYFRRNVEKHSKLIEKLYKKNLNRIVIETIKIGNNNIKEIDIRFLKMCYEDLKGYYTKYYKITQLQEEINALYLKYSENELNDFLEKTLLIPNKTDYLIVQKMIENAKNMGIDTKLAEDKLNKIKSIKLEKEED